MREMSRRSFLCAAGWAVGLLTAAPRPTDIRIEEVTFEYEDYLYRAPYQFGGRTVDRVTLLNVHCTVRSMAGRVARGFGSMTMGNQWAFPSSVMSYDQTLGAMKALAERLAKLTGDCKEAGHPVDINAALEPAYLAAAVEVSRQSKLAEPIPKLCTLVVASPFDAAVHDAFGKLHGRSCYRTYGPDLMGHDLSRYLGAEFTGEYLSRYVRAKPMPRVALYHSVGAADPITASDVRWPVGDGLPETLADWIRYNGLTHFKMKLNGGDLQADRQRILAIDRTVTEAMRARSVARWLYCLDFNERCPNVEYLLDCLRYVKEKTPSGFERIQYVEQPTARDLKANPGNRMHEAAKLRPVVADESLTDLESLMLAREMGYTGVALKACKGQSQAVLTAAAAQKHGLFLCVQDLTCPGASFIHSAGIAAHVPGTAAIEGNARQYVPAANKAWAGKFPTLFQIRDGRLGTSVLTRPGLGAI